MTEGSASVKLVSGVPQSSVLEQLLYILYTSGFLHIVWNHIVGCSDDTSIYAVIPRSLLRPQVMESLNQYLAAIDTWRLKWHMRLNPKNTKSMVVNGFQSYSPGYGDLILSGVELAAVRSLRNSGVTLDCKLTFETHLREDVSNASRSLGVVRHARKLFDCSRALKSCFNAYVLSSQEYCFSLCRYCLRSA